MVVWQPCKVPEQIPTTMSNPSAVLIGHIKSFRTASTEVY